MEKTITCINCPVGCRMTVLLAEDGHVSSVSGNTCPRGEKYAVQECTLPERMITAVLPVDGSSVPLSVKTSRPVPKNLISDIMEELSRLHLTAPVYSGQIVLTDILGTGADIIATKSV